MKFAIAALLGVAVLAGNRRGDRNDGYYYQESYYPDEGYFGGDEHYGPYQESYYFEEPSYEVYGPQEYGYGRVEEFQHYGPAPQYVEY